jgi:hypothetical protein
MVKCNCPNYILVQKVYYKCVDCVICYHNFTTLHFLLRSKYSTQHPVLKQPQSMFLLYCDRPSFSPILKMHNYSFRSNLCMFYPCNSPWRSIGLWDVEAPVFSRQSAHRWRRGCQSYAPAGRPLPPGRFLVLISVKRRVDPRSIVRLEGLGQLKIPMTSSGLEPAAFRFVAQCLNQVRYRVPLTRSMAIK